LSVFSRACIAASRFNGVASSQGGKATKRPPIHSNRHVDRHRMSQTYAFLLQSWTTFCRRQWCDRVCCSRPRQHFPVPTAPTTTSCPPGLTDKRNVSWRIFCNGVYRSDAPTAGFIHTGS
jgi:hypothetical protein